MKKYKFAKNTNMDTQQVEKTPSKKKTIIIYCAIAGILLLSAGFFFWQNYQNGKTDVGYSTAPAEMTTAYSDIEDYDYYNKMLFDINEYDKISQNYRE